MNTQDPNYGIVSEDGNYWWDGDGWQPIATQPLPIATRPLPVAERRSKIPVIAAGVAVAFLILVVIGTALGGGETEEPVATSSSAPTDTPEPEPTDTPEPEPEPSDTPEPEPADNGEAECREYISDDVSSTIGDQSAILTEGQELFDGYLNGSVSQSEFEVEAAGISGAWAAQSVIMLGHVGVIESTCPGWADADEVVSSLEDVSKSAEEWSQAFIAVAVGDVEKGLGHAENAGELMTDALATIERVS